jgi:hypothetical protein
MIIQNEKLNAILDDVPKETWISKMNCLFLFGLLEKVLSEKDEAVRNQRINDMKNLLEWKET